MHSSDLAARQGLRWSAAAWTALAACGLLAALAIVWGVLTCAPTGAWCGAAGLGLAARQQASATHTASLTATPSLSATSTPPAATATAFPSKQASPTSAPLLGAAPNSPDLTATASPTLAPAATATARPGCVLYPGSAGPHSIPDNDPAGLSVTALVPAPSLPLTSVGVRIDELRHTYVGDLRLRLLAPGGADLVLVDQVGNDSDDFYRTAFYDSAPVAVADGVGPFTGDFRPDQSLAPLNGAASGGAWTLVVSDLVGGDTGTLYAWSVELCAAGSLPPPAVTGAIPTSGGALSLSFEAAANVSVAAGSAPETINATLATTGTRALPAGAVALGNFFAISATDGQGAPMTALDEPVRVTITYADGAVPGPSEVAIKLVAWDGAAGAYVLVPATRNPGTNTISADLVPLTEFGAVAQGYELYLPHVRGGSG